MKKILILIFLAVIVGSYFLVEREMPVLAPTADNKKVEETDARVPFTVFPVEHASFVAKLGETVIYNDPIGEAALFQKQGPADILLLTDIHGDHLSTSTISSLLTSTTKIIAPQAVFDLLTTEQKARTTVLNNDEEITVSGIKVKAVPMYNLPESAESRHTKGRGNGYVLTQGSTDVYVAGDTADIQEMRALTSIDFAFIPMNLPYTMSVESAADAVLAFKPRVVYPYHYRTPEGKSDVQKFKELVTGGDSTITVELLLWYGDESVTELPATAGVGAKINIQVVCEGALAYTDFADAAAAEDFVADCVAGKHPEVVDRYIESLGVDGAVI